MLELNKVYNMDCLEGMRQIPDESIDLILTDPPYGISFLSNRTDHQKEIIGDKFEDFSQQFPLWLSEFRRILKPLGCCCCVAAISFSISLYIVLSWVYYVY